MKFAEKSRYDMILLQKKRKRMGISNALHQDISKCTGSIRFSRKYLLKNKLMHIFLDNFHKGGKYYAKIAIHQAELRREESFTRQKNLNLFHP